MSDIELEKVFFFHVERMMKAVNDHTLKVFKGNNFPITKDQWVILKKISEVEGSTQKQIADSTFKDPAALTRILDILEKKGFVIRQNSDEDRRSFDIHLTVDGRRLVNRMLPFVQGIRAKAMLGITANEEAESIKVLGKVYENMI